MNISEIKEMIQAVVDSGVAELKVQRGENRVRIVRGGIQQEVVLASASPANTMAYQMAPATNSIQVPSAPVGPCRGRKHVGGEAANCGHLLCLGFTRRGSIR